MTPESYRLQYRTMYAAGKKSNGFHSRPYLQYIEALKIKSLIDVGCGDGSFPIWCKDHGVEEVYGLDWEHPVPNDNRVTWIQEDLLKIPLPDKHVEYITGFDVLEHIFPEQI